MLLVKTKIWPSIIHWIWLFADQFIPKWTEIWRFTPWFDLKYTKEEFAKLPILIQDHLNIYCWLSDKSSKYIFSTDHWKFFNHSSDNYNVLSAYYDNEEEVVTKAVRDIQAWEELTDDYCSFEKRFNESYK